MIGKVFPMNLKKQLACLYTNYFFTGLRITDAVWVALLAARGFSLWEIGFAESVFHIVSLLCEVPSGMAADLLGRKKALVFGGVCVVLYNLLMAFAPNLFFICVAMGLNAFASTMFSGTTSALTYDSLKQCGKSDDYLKVSATCSQITNLTTALGSLFSTLERFLRFSGFYLLSAAFECTGTLATALMEEPIVTEAQASREKQALRDLPSQLVQLVKDSIKVLRSCPLAAKLIVSSAVVCIPSYLTKMFVQQRLTQQGWAMEWLFLPGLLAGAAGMAGASLGRRLHPKRLRALYFGCALLVGTGTLLAGAAPALLCAAGPVLVQGALSVWFLHSMQRLNDAIPSDRRATLISVDSMAYSLLMIPASPLVGLVGDLTGQAGAGLCVLCALVVVSGLAAAGKTRYNGRGA